MKITAVVSLLFVFIGIYACKSQSRQTSIADAVSPALNDGGAKPSAGGSAASPSSAELQTIAPAPVDTYEPRCSYKGIEAGGFKMAFAGAKGSKGYMRRIAGTGFSCKLNPDSDGDNALPTCSAACPEQKSPMEGEWGWCEGSLGFVCLN